MTGQNTLDTKSEILSAAMIIVAAILVVYIPAMQSGFVWDDDSMLTNNLVLNENGLYRSWFTTAQINYWPITWTSYWAEHKLWGLNPAGYHITNILIHTACALLIWRILVLLKIPAAWLAALIFAVHPVNVESVAWIAQRKTILAMLFFLITLLLYLKFEGSNDFLFYWLSMGTFILAMLSKGSVVGLPIVLLLIVWWRKGTITRRDFLHSLPFFAISAVMSCVEIWFQTNRAIGEDVIRNDNFFARSAGAGMAVWFYIYKAILPINLIFIYPRWDINPANWLVYVPLISLIGIFLLFWRYRHSWGKQLLFALSYYVVMLLPILGFFNIYFMRYSLVADHYQYASIIGVIALIAAAGHHLTNRLGKQRNDKIKIAAAIIVAVLGILTLQQSRAYKNAETLWNDTLRKNPNSWPAHNNLGSALLLQGKVNEAIGHYYQILKIRPGDAEAHNNLGIAFGTQGKFVQAFEHYLQALQTRPDFANAHYNFGNDLQACGQLDEAVKEYRKALQIKPDDADAHYNLAKILQSQDKTDEAVKHYNEAVRTKPKLVGAYNNLADIFLSQDKLEEAADCLQKALKIEPGNANIHYNLAGILQLKNKTDEAVAHYKQVLQFKPDDVEAHYKLGELLQSQGKFAEAALHYYQALRTEPNNIDAHNNLGIVLGTQNKFDEAIKHFQKILELAPDNAEAYNNLGIAFEQTNKLDEAIDCYRKAMQLKQDWPLPMAGLAKILATHPDINKRNIAEAIKLAERAAELTKYQNIIILETLASVYAAAGQFDKAAIAEQKVLDLISAEGNNEAVKQISEQLERYKQHLK